MVSNNFEFECQINHESILILGDAYIVLGCVMVAHHSLVYKVSTSLIGYYQQPHHQLEQVSRVVRTEVYYYISYLQFF